MLDKNSSILSFISSEIIHSASLDCGKYSGLYKFIFRSSLIEEYAKNSRQYFLERR